MRRQKPMKLHLNKETLRNLAEREMQEVAGGATAFCQETGLSLCNPCVTDVCETRHQCGG